MFPERRHPIRAAQRRCRALDDARRGAEAGFCATASAVAPTAIASGQGGESRHQKSTLTLNFTSRGFRTSSGCLNAA